MEYTWIFPKSDISIALVVSIAYFCFLHFWLLLLPCYFILYCLWFISPINHNSKGNNFHILGLTSIVKKEDSQPSKLYSPAHVKITTSWLHIMSWDSAWIFLWLSSFCILHQMSGFFVLIPNRPRWGSCITESQGIKEKKAVGHSASVIYYLWDRSMMPICPLPWCEASHANLNMGSVMS